MRHIESSSIKSQELAGHRLSFDPSRPKHETTVISNDLQIFPKKLIAWIYDMG